MLWRFVEEIENWGGGGGGLGLLGMVVGGGGKVGSRTKRS